MRIDLSSNPKELGEKAAHLGAQKIREALAEKGRANIILATGASQFQMLEALVRMKDLDWSRVTAFHLDEYIGMSDTHPASFRRYLKERFLDKVRQPGPFVFIAGDAKNTVAEMQRVSKKILEHPIDVAFIGIGENGHLAFNDPPADFDTEEPYIAVELELKCREQQLGEGWFKDLSEVPMRAISMSVRQILKSRTLICSVPDRRKAEAVKNTLEGAVTNLCPASILQTHRDTHLFLDNGSAALLKGGARS